MVYKIIFRKDSLEEDYEQNKLAVYCDTDGILRLLSEQFEPMEFEQHEHKGNPQALNSDDDQSKINQQTADDSGQGSSVNDAMQVEQHELQINSAATNSDFQVQTVVNQPETVVGENSDGDDGNEDVDPNLSQEDEEQLQNLAYELGLFPGDLKNIAKDFICNLKKFIQSQFKQDDINLNKTLREFLQSDGTNQYDLKSFLNTPIGNQIRQYYFGNYKFVKIAIKGKKANLELLLKGVKIYFAYC